MPALSEKGKIASRYTKLKIINVHGVTVYQNNNIQFSKNNILYINAGKLKDGIYSVILYDNNHENTYKMIVNN